MIMNIGDFMKIRRDNWDGSNWVKRGWEHHTTIMDGVGTIKIGTPEEEWSVCRECYVDILHCRAKLRSSVAEAAPYMSLRGYLCEGK